MSLKKFFRKGILEAGCDEAGRGCLAGPVVASAVILPHDFHHPLLNDSKQVIEKDRFQLREIIIQEAIAYSVSFVKETEIDKINILNASILAMQNAVDELRVKPELLLIDGNRFKKHRNYLHECIVKGDSKYASIAAASILAKTYRDDYMDKIHTEFPMYDWKKNKGYPTKRHREGIRNYGSCIYHRKSFTLLPPQLEIDF